MRVLVLSDSHGNIENMRSAVERTQPQLIFHLGDYVRDGLALASLYPDIPVVQVAGNCDAGQLCPPPLLRLYELEGHRILLTHGHQYHVKSGLLALEYAAMEQGAELALFGHTHIPQKETSGNVTLLNPGSIGSVQPSFAVIETENRQLRTALIEL